MSSMNEAIDEELARKYGSFASYQSDFAPAFVDYYGENPADEVQLIPLMVGRHNKYSGGIDVCAIL